jgi:hypothetical protein
MSPFIAEDTHARLGEAVGSGHCMAHVQAVADVTHSSTLRQGEKVRGNEIPPGTVIGTFDATGCYANATDGSSHVAVLVEQTPDGLKVVDQWQGQPVHERLIRFKGGRGPACDDGDQYHVVEAA